MEDKHKIPIGFFILVGAALFRIARGRNFRRIFFIFEGTLRSYSNP